MTELLSIEETAELLHVSPRTLLNYRQRAHGPVPTRVGFRRVFYQAADVEQYLAAMREQSLNECIAAANGEEDA